VQLPAINSENGAFLPQPERVSAVITTNKFTIFNGLVFMSI